MSKMKLHPFYECCKKMEELSKGGVQCYQKFLCENCNTIQTMEEPNHVWKFGICEECKHTTNIEKNGMNYLIIASSPEAQETIFKDLLK